MVEEKEVLPNALHIWIISNPLMILELGIYQCHYFSDLRPHATL